MWLIFALLSCAAYAVAEQIDSFFVNRKFKNPVALIFYSSLFNIIYVLGLYFFVRPALPSMGTLWLFILLGFVNVGYLWPYYKGLQDDDASVAISFLALERIMVPVLAFLLVGEVLYPIQYVGIIVIIASVVLLALHHSRKRFRLSKGVWHIAWASLFLAFEAIFLKMLFDQGVSVSTAIGGEALVSLFFGLSVAVLSSARKDIASHFGIFLKISPVYFMEELFTFLGLFFEGSAISRTSVSVAKAVTMASPFFLIFYAEIGKRFFPTVFKEDLRRRRVFRKIILFMVLLVGIALVSTHV